MSDWTMVLDEAELRLFLTHGGWDPDDPDTMGEHSFPLLVAEPDDIYGAPMSVTVADAERLLAAARGEVGPVCACGRPSRHESGWCGECPTRCGDCGCRLTECRECWRDRFLSALGWDDGQRTVDEALDRVRALRVIESGDRGHRAMLDDYHRIFERMEDAMRLSKCDPDDLLDHVKRLERVRSAAAVVAKRYDATVLPEMVALREALAACARDED